MEEERERTRANEASVDSKWCAQEFGRWREKEFCMCAFQVVAWIIYLRVNLGVCVCVRVFG